MRLTLLLLFLISISSLGQSQGSICGATIPLSDCPVDTTLCIWELSDDITITSPSSLPDLEFAIMDLNVPSTSNTGPAIIAIIPDSRFIPFDIGVDSATTLQIMPVAYDLAAIQETLDDILKGTFTIFSIPCCTVAPDVCTQLMDAGINCGSDFTSLSQAFSLFSADTSALFSISDFIDGIDSVNTTLGGPIPSECGGGDMICYAYGAPCTFEVIEQWPLITFTSPAHLTDTIAIADSIHSSATIVTGISVEYLFGIEVILEAGFETENNSEFIIESSEGCQ